ncbi:MAG: minor capsid protein, partial [Arenibacter algicola]|nr:minor capsid protein [Arenibacter algicola]
VQAIKRAFLRLGFYEAPHHGITPYPDTALFDAIEAFQRKDGLKTDGVMKPGGETESALKTAAERVRRQGRFGDTVLEHITPEEATLLYAQGGAGTINPVTGLLEFYDNTKKDGKYIWRTRGDGKVRSSHADRDGKVFSWDDPPEGGHPGEAPNCRCRAEPVEGKDTLCNELKHQITNQELTVQYAERTLDEIQKEMDAMQKKENDIRNSADDTMIGVVGKIGMGAAIGAAEGSVVPGLGTMGGAIVGAGKEAATSVGDVYHSHKEADVILRRYEDLKRRRDSASEWLDQQRRVLNELRFKATEIGC